MDTSKSDVDSPLEQDGLLSFVAEEGSGEPVAAVVRSHWARSQNRQSVRRLKTVRARREVSRLRVRFSKFAVGVAVGALIASSDGTSPGSRLVTSTAVTGSAVLKPPVVRPTTGAAPVDAVGTAGKSAAIRATAPASPRPSGHRGTLIVTSQPVGASVFVNNRLAGRTPLVMNALPIGSRAVRLSLDGYAPWSRGVSVVANQSTTVSAKLEPGK